jgi:hypothetical protein
MLLQPVLVGGVDLVAVAVALQNLQVRRRSRSRVLCSVGTIWLLTRDGLFPCDCLRD